MPREISSFDQLIDIIREEEDAEIILTDDLQVSQEGFKIGKFEGVLDGNGHKITNFSEYEVESAGLFSSVISLNSGIIKNLRIPDLNIESNRENIVTMGFVGKNTGVIKNCEISGVIVRHNSKTEEAGSIAGLNYGLIKDCQSSTSLYLNGPSCTCGGIAGRNTGTIKNCHYTNGKLKSESVGGIVRKNSSKGKIEKSSFEGSIKNGKYIGGVAHTNTGEIISSYIKNLNIDDSDEINSMGVISDNSRGVIKFCSWIKGQVPNSEPVKNNEGVIEFVKPMETIDKIEGYILIGEI